MSYVVEFSTHAARQFRKLPKNIQHRLMPRIDALAHNPRPAGVKKLSGTEPLYRIRLGDYRILYEIQARALIVLVVEIGNRREVYRSL